MPRSKIEELRESTSDGKLPFFAWPGGYPIAYYAMETAGTYCPDCANQTEAYPEIDEADINWEDANMFCDGCGKKIESAYGED